MLKKWTIKDSLELYNIPNWGRHFFTVNEDGDLIATPSGADGGEINIHSLVQELELRGIQSPILLRFTDIIRSRIGD